MFKYLKDKKSRRRGVAIELAIFVIMLCFGLSIIIVTTSMIQKNNHNRMVAETTEKLELNRIGAEFCSAIKEDKMPFFEWKLSQETEYLNSDKYVQPVIKDTGDASVKELKIQKKDNAGNESDVILWVVMEYVDGAYKITKWEYKILNIKNEKYAITLELNGGTIETSLYEYDGTVDVELPIPTKEGRVFAGWYDNSEFSGSPVEKILAGESCDKTYYAKWE
jgi:uncharacterized repeat protein (TIGR02543 family)